MKKNIRFFEAESPPILMESIYTLAYKDINCRALRQNNKVTVFFEDFDMEKTLNMGCSLIDDDSHFKEYIKKFYDFLSSVDNILSMAIAKNDRLKLVELFVNFLSFYRLTEFFYTDKIYKRAYETDDKVALSKLNMLERLKTIGRKFIIKFFNGKNSYIEQISDNQNDKLPLRPPF